MSLRPCSDLVRPLLKHPCFISARIKNALHNLSLPLKPPASPQCFTIPPQNFKIRAVGATTIIHYSFFIIHHSLSSPPTPPFPPSPPLFTIPRPALSKIEIRAVGATTILHSSLFIIHYSSFILHFPPSPAAPRSPSRSPPRRPASFFRPIHTRTCS